MSGIKCYSSCGLRFVAKCDFCGKSAEYVWLLFESSDGKNHICNECVQDMMETMCCIADGCDDEVVD
jgi:hypothetical protein